MAKTGYIGLVIKGELKEMLINLAKKERRTQTTILEQALLNYFKAKKLSPWDKLPKSKQEAMMKKAKDLIKE
jgi:hypothetical protein